MTIDNTITTIKRELIRTFAVLDEWFDKDDTFHCFKPLSGKWSPGEVLEHVMLTCNYLLILIDKGCTKALKQAEACNLDEVLQNYTFTHPDLEEIGTPEAFVWERPEHMVPTGTKALRDVRGELREQLYRCLCTLELLNKGQGVLYKTTMTVNNLGKLDVYQYIHFLSLHARRHIAQLKRIEEEFNKQLS